MPDDRPDGPASTSLVAELWYAAAPDLGDPALLTRLRAAFPGAQAQDGSITVPHGEPGPDGATLLTVAVAASPLGEGGKARPDVSQTWAWPEAEAALDGCGASVLVTELRAGRAQAADRVSALSGVLAELVAQTGPTAISWAHSQRVSDPEAFLVDDLDGIINVRLFMVAGQPGVLVMDTLGLHVLGLPDVQCHFRDREPGEVAAMLFSTGVYLVDAGDVIGDGNTISEPSGAGRYPCHRETSLLAPSRLVLDVDLGEPYAAGERDRSSG